MAGAAAADAAAAVDADVAGNRGHLVVQLGLRRGVMMVTVDVEASGRRSRAVDHPEPAVEV